MKSQLRGQGYMKKGGAPATEGHNLRVRQMQAVSTPGSVDRRLEPARRPDAARTRVSAGVSWPLLASVWVAGLGIGGTTVALVEAVAR